MAGKNNQYFFKDKKELVSYLIKKLSNPTPLKIQKSLYFLWAFYAATYGNIDYKEETDFNLQDRYPRELFEAQFEAWRYGPVISEIYEDYKYRKEDLENFSKRDRSMQLTENEREVFGFIDDLISQIDHVNDFGLVKRSHQDTAWKNAFKEGQFHSKMDNQEIKRDYIEYVKQQSKI